MILIKNQTNTRAQYAQVFQLIKYIHALIKIARFSNFLSQNGYNYA